MTEIKVGQVWRTGDGEIVCAVEIQSAGVIVAHAAGGTVGYTRRSFNGWELVDVAALLAEVERLRAQYKFLGEVHEKMTGRAMSYEQGFDHHRETLRQVRDHISVECDDVEHSRAWDVLREREPWLFEEDDDDR